MAIPAGSQVSLTFLLQNMEFCILRQHRTLRHISLYSLYIERVFFSTFLRVACICPWTIVWLREDVESSIHCAVARYVNAVRIFTWG